MTTLWCATTNPGKLREFRLAGAAVQPVPGLRDIPAPPEDGATFEENAARKAVYYSRFAPGLLFADDSGIEVDALGGEPGVYSARFAGAQATDAENNALLLERLRGKSNRRGRFVCVIALAQAGELVRAFRGVAEGEILEAPRGANGFGYDPLFFYPPLGCGFGVLGADEKFAVSHRGKALREMLEWVAKQA
jgi:XTP/dITP diphosphohydrolase